MHGKFNEQTNDKHSNYCWKAGCKKKNAHTIILYYRFISSIVQWDNSKIEHPPYLLYSSGYR